MTPRPVRRLAAAAALTALPFTGFAADSLDATAQSAIQMLADVTLIDGECRNVTVDFGRALRAGEADGVRPVEILPTGAWRPAFEAAYRLRFAQTPHDDLCDRLVKLYGSIVPGLFRSP